MAPVDEETVGLSGGQLSKETTPAPLDGTTRNVYSLLEPSPESGTTSKLHLYTYIILIEDVKY